MKKKLGRVKYCYATEPNPKYRWYNTEPKYITHSAYLKVDKSGYVVAEKIK